MVGLELRLVSGFILTLGIFLVLGINTYRNNRTSFKRVTKSLMPTRYYRAPKRYSTGLSMPKQVRGVIFSGSDEYLKPCYTSRSSFGNTLRESRGHPLGNVLLQETIEVNSRCCLTS